MSNRTVNYLVSAATLIAIIVSLSMVTDAVDKHNSNKAVWAILIAYLIGTLVGWMTYSELSKRKKK